LRSLKGMIKEVGLIAMVATLWVYGRPLSDRLHLGRQEFDLRQQRPAEVSRTFSGDKIVDGYKQWTRVNPVPAVLPSRIAKMCFTPTAKQIKMEEDNPHNDKFITVYVNDIGRHAMMEHKVSRFPKGSVIVKEKLATKDSSSPELLTVMIKREVAYNPENGDWEYMGLDGSGKTVQARGKLEKCQACHRTVSHNDYVYREYLPEEVWKKLR